MKRPGSKLIMMLAVVLLMLMAIVPAAQAQQATGSVANVYYLNLRGGPGVEYARVAVLTNGQFLTLVGRNTDATWVQVVAAPNLVGWVNSRYVATATSIFSLPITFTTTPPAPPTPQPPVTGTAIVTANFLNLRSGPAANFDILSKLVNGQSMTLLGRNADASWVNVSVPNVGSGWVSARYILPYVPVASLPVISQTGVNPGFPDPVPSGGQTGIVNAYFLNVRTGPAAYFRAFRVISNGEGVYLIARNLTNTWLLVQMADGHTGWVSSSYITTSYPIGNLPVR